MFNKTKQRKVPLPPHKRRYIRSFMVTVIVLFFFFAIVSASLNDARKPAVYLYPTENMQIQVSLDVNGIIHDDIPDYNSGWDVFVTTEGLIENQYDYLFYEALLWRVQVPEEGWVVPYSDIVDWLESMLPELGLNEKETSQFIEYWAEELPTANYYEIKLLDESYLNKNMKLIVSPDPDTVIRLMFHFKPLSKNITIKEPVISTPQRSGFTVVEWGGLLDK